MRKLITIATLFLIAIAIQPAHALDAIGPGMYDNTIPQIVYSGAGVSWATVSDGTGYGGSRINSGLTTSTNPLISFDIWGGGFTLYIAVNVNGGTGNVCVDGNCTSFSWYSVSSGFSTISYTGLSYGTHTVTIQKTSTTSTAINLDGLYVAPPPNPPTSNPPTPIVVITLVYPTPQPTPTGTQYMFVGNWDDMPEVTDDPSIVRFDVDDSEGNPTSVALIHQIDAGQIGGIILQVAIVGMLMVIFITLARRK